MSSKQFVWIAMFVLAGLTGCAMCDNAQDCTYSAFGGKWQRQNPSSGRVASLFDPAGGQVFAEGSPTEAEQAVESTEQADEAEKAEGAEKADEAEMAEGAEKAWEATEPAMEEPAESEDGGRTPAPEAAEVEAAKPEANSADGRKTTGGVLELPVMPGESAESSKPRQDDSGLLPPLELPPQP